MRKIHLTIGATLLALLAACGGSDKNPTGPGNAVATFSASLAGDVTAQLNGFSSFGVNPNAGEENVNFALSMATGTQHSANGSVIIFYRAQPGLPAVGQHPVVGSDVEEPAANQFLGFMILQSNHMCEFIGGTLTFSATSGSRVRGSFDATALCVDLGSEEMNEITVTVQGQFDAPKAVMPNS